jgi:tRNA-specific 2-thiouridylase
MAKILAAMSGGVDSSVAALLLKQQGHEVIGAYMKNWINEENIIGDCPWQDDIKDARAVAEKIGIEFRIVNLMKDYREKVVHYLLEGYESGITPNPDVMCNREIKFGVFLDYAKENGFEHVATGHYAQLRANEDKTFDILEGADKNKDQSYFLALMQQHQVKHALFPMGHLPKPEVRKIAEQYDLITAAKKDSQGICFIGEVKMSDFLKAFVPDKPGKIVNLQGKTVGEHAGLHYYTLGQRKGIRVPSNTENMAYVVVEKRKETNELVIGFDLPETEGLYTNEWLVSNVTFTNHSITKEKNILIRPRYRSKAVGAQYIPLDNHQVRVIFDQPQRAVTTGQICAMYDGEVLLGGGIFAEKIIS